LISAIRYSVAAILRREFDVFVLRDPHPELAVLRGMEKVR